jgi:hypothetical protein
MNVFNKVEIKLTVEQAQELLELARQLNYEQMTTGQVMSLNGLQYALEAVTEQESEDVA